MEEVDQLLTWGVVCGIHQTEENAIAAMERGEVVERVNPSTKGPKVLYEVFSLKGHT